MNSSSSSRSRSSSSPWSESGPNQGDTASSVSNTPLSTPSKRPAAASKRPLSSRSGLAKPFRSPLKRPQSQRSMSSTNAPSPPPAEQAAEATSADAAASSSTSARKQRQALEAKLLLLQQANKCLREGALSSLPQDIARWREAGQLAAQDLWKLTGADAGDWSGLSSIPSRGDYGLESPSSTFVGTSDAHKRKADSPAPSNPPLLLRRTRVTSPGAEEEAAALRSIDDLVRHSKEEDSQGALSETSLPDVSELLRRSQSIVGSSQTPRQRKSLLGTQEEGGAVPSSLAAGGMGIERKWNIGSMLDMLGADKSLLAWNVEEEEFNGP